MRATVKFSFDPDDTDDNEIVRKTCDAVNMNLSYFDGADDLRMKAVQEVIAQGVEFSLHDIHNMKEEIDGMYRWVVARVVKFSTAPEHGFVEEMRKEWENREDLLIWLRKNWEAELIWATNRAAEYA